MSIWIWIGFLLFVAVMVLLDLGVFHRKAHAMSIPEALAWTAVWVVLALAFNVLVYFLYEQNWGRGSVVSTEHLSGQQGAVQFFTGYVLEKSLSIDNIFVIAMIFASLRVPLAEQHRVLYWGILGAVVLRGVMIAIGAALIEQIEWIVYVFGALLLLSAVKMLIVRHDNIDPNRNLAVRLTKRVFPVSDHFDGSHFFTSIGGRRAVTPLFMALVLVESSDVMFAVDSIPAIFAVTRDPFLVFTSNVFAILGLRSLYFALAGLMERFRYLKMSLVFVLAYVGVKMMLSHHHPIPNAVSLAIIGGILGVGLVASLFSGRDTAKLHSPLLNDFGELAVASYKQARRIVILVVGATVVLLGIAMLVLPGPGLVAILLGLAILAVEFAWARRWLKQLKRKTNDARKGVAKWLQGEDVDDNGLEATEKPTDLGR